MDERTREVEEKWEKEFKSDWDEHTRMAEQYCGRSLVATLEVLCRIYYFQACRTRIKELEVGVDKLTLSKQDAEGQLNILRPEYCKLQERVKELEYIMTSDPDHWDSAYVKWAMEESENKVRGLVEGIKKHKKVMEDHGLLDDSGKYFTTKADNELYKIIEKEEK